MKEKLINLLEAINKLEVKGQENILLLYNIMSFLINEIKTLESLEQENKEGD